MHQSHGLPTMTAAGFADLVEDWKRQAVAELRAKEDALATPTGIRVDFQIPNPAPVPRCPACNTPADAPHTFRVVGHVADHEPGPHLHFTDCGHQWSITDLAATTNARPM